MVALDCYYYAGIFEGPTLVSSRARISFNDDHDLRFSTGRPGLVWLVDELWAEVMRFQQ